MDFGAVLDAAIIGGLTSLVFSLAYLVYRVLTRHTRTTIKIIKEIEDPKTREMYQVGCEYSIKKVDAKWLCDNGYAVETVKEASANTNSTVCGECGYKILQRFSDEKWCRNCGNKLDNKKQSTATPKENTSQEVKVRRTSVAETTKPVVTAKTKKEKLIELREFFEEGLITEKDYEISRRKIIDAD